MFMHTNYCFYWGLLSVVLISINACSTPFIPDCTYEYIHISHTRGANVVPQTIDEIAAEINYDRYYLRFLGGDLSYFSTADTVILNYLQETFDIQSQQTHWAVGNHDYSDIELLETYTQRKTYYASYYKGISIVVLDTEMNGDNIIGEQLNLLSGVIDTLSASSYLLLLHHKLIFMPNNAELKHLTNDVANGPLGDCSYCTKENNNFYTQVYPLLETAQLEKNIQVLCIAGDLGHKVSTFSHRTPEGIYFLASGIHAEHKGNKALVFSHNVHNQILTWEFIALDSLCRKEA